MAVLIGECEERLRKKEPSIDRSRIRSIARDIKIIILSEIGAADRDRLNHTNQLKAKFKTLRMSFVPDTGGELGSGAPLPAQKNRGCPQDAANKALQKEMLRRLLALGCAGIPIEMAAIDGEGKKFLATTDESGKTERKNYLGHAVVFTGLRQIISDKNKIISVLEFRNSHQEGHHS